jgi:hypothetical protein
MMNVNEMLYHEVKGKWNSLYPIYFDKSKTVKEGKASIMKEEKFQRNCVSRIRVFKS